MYSGGCLSTTGDAWAAVEESPQTAPPTMNKCTLDRQRSYGEYAVLVPYPCNGSAGSRNGEHHVYELLGLPGKPENAQTSWRPGLNLVVPEFRLQ